MMAQKPTGWSTVTPRLITSDVEGLAAFVRTAFEATGEVRTDRPSELRIGDSILMISDGGGLRSEMPAFLHLYVADADETYSRAIDAGAETIEAPENMSYGDRRATVSDKWGNIWQIATFRARR